jgi:hypothetical protein
MIKRSDIATEPDSEVQTVQVDDASAFIDRVWCAIMKAKAESPEPLAALLVPPAAAYLLETAMAMDQTWAFSASFRGQGLMLFGLPVMLAHVPEVAAIRAYSFGEACALMRRAKGEP